MITARFFQESEFQNANPACSLQDMHPETMRRLDLARSIAGIPFVVNSAFRTVEHEKRKGRTGTSSHTTGRAVDIRCNTDRNRYLIITVLLIRIGVHRTFIHVDDSPMHTAQVIFFYWTNCQISKMAIWWQFPQNPQNPHEWGFWGFVFNKHHPTKTILLMTIWLLAVLLVCVDAVYLQPCCLQTTHVHQPLMRRSRVVHSRHTAIINLAVVGVGAVTAAMSLLWVGVSVTCCYFWE